MTDTRTDEGSGYLAMLRGAVIASADRQGPWLVLQTNRGKFMAAGGRVRLDLECPRCQEFRLVEIVTTGAKQEGVCAVCAHVWRLDRPTQKVGSTGE